MKMKLNITTLFTVTLLSIFQNILVNSQKNNACRNYISYFNIYSNSDCYYIPDANNDVSEIIQRHIGLFEQHEVLTEDGYVLDLFRIPKQDPKGVIVMQHPFTVDSKIWVNQYKESTAFIFWKAGYDVWLANNRGTLYGKRHINLTHTDKKFWDYSFHDIGLYDQSATIKYIRRKTNGSKIISIGHSMGASSSLVYASLKPKEAADSLKVIVNMGTVAYPKNASTPVSTIMRFGKPIQKFCKLLNLYSMLNHESLILKFGRSLLTTLPFKKWIVYLISLFTGWTPKNYDIQYYNMMIFQFGSEVSMNVFYHYSQIWNADGRFQMYDYGKNKNLKLYGNETPPLYPVQKIKTPVYLVYSEDDSVSHPKDNELLFEKLPKQAKIYGKLAIKGLNHLDYHYGKNRIKNVYEKILRFLDVL